MCAGVALLWSELPLEFIDRHGLDDRAHERGGEKEVRFLYRQREPVLPVWHEGQLLLARWGGKRRGKLPATGWTWLATVEAGGWAQYEAEPVILPANYGLEKGVWFRIRQGLRGLLVRDEEGEPVVYVICEPPTRYYRVMTRSDRMPVLIDEVI